MEAQRHVFELRGEKARRPLFRWVGICQPRKQTCAVEFKSKLYRYSLAEVLIYVNLSVTTSIRCCGQLIRMVDPCF